MGVVMIVRGMRRSKHAWIVSKWCPTMNLAIKDNDSEEFRQTT